MSELNHRSQQFLHLVRAYAPSPGERDGHAALLDLLTSGETAFDRDVFAPGHVTAGAFAVHDDAVMMIHHRRLGIWIEPGGHVDATDATPQATAARELEEETGVVVGDAIGGIFDVDVHDIPAAGQEPAHQHFNVCYRFEAGSRRVEQAAEVLDARWVPLDEVDSLTADEAVLRAIAKLRDVYRR